MSTDADALLLGVFHEPNAISLSDINQRRTREARAAAPLIALFRRDADGPVLLPRRRPDGGTRWYGVVRDAAGARLFSEQILAFVGPTYTNFVGAAADLDLNDSVERAIADFVDGAAFAIDVEAGHEVDVCNQVSLLAQVHAAKPLGGRVVRRTLDAALRDFDVALQVRDAEGSDALLSELTSLGAHNLLFLRVRRLAALERWQELLALPHLATVLAARRPQAVTRDLLRAIYAVHLATFESPAQPSAALRYFQQNIREPFAPLLVAWGGMRDEAVLKTFMLLAATDSDTAFRDTLLAAAPVGAAGESLLMLAALVDGPPIAPAGDPARDARELIDAFRFDAAWHLLHAAEASRAVVALLISCAVEFRSVATATATLEALDALPDADRDALLRSRVIALQIDALHEELGERGATIEATTTEPSPEPSRTSLPASGLIDSGPADAGAAPVAARVGGWHEWLARIDDGWARQSALKIARSGATEWPLDALIDEPDRLAALLDLITADRSPTATATLRMATPSLIEALGPVDHSQLVPLYLDLALSLRLSDGFAANDMALVADLAQRALRAGVDAVTYDAIIDDYLDVWKEHGSPHRLDWLLDAIDDLLSVSSATQGGPERLFVAALAWCGHPRHRSRVESHQWAAFRSLAEDLERATEVDALADADAGIPVADAPRVAAEPVAVGVYTLQERAGLAAQRLIEARYPNASVTVRHDKANSTALEHLANTADVFIVAWQSAKHAATDAITAARPKDRPVVYAAGTGRSSIVRAFETAIGVG